MFKRNILKVSKAFSSANSPKNMPMLYNSRRLFSITNTQFAGGDKLKQRGNALEEQWARKEEKRLLDKLAKANTEGEKAKIEKEIAKLQKKRDELEELE